ncbi:MAG: amino acid ABC transporter substrate-binding protein [Proteobacteria bacterium]|nr:amino acid ABC transporter substrate-binding protein [Pseudomonadota bacterium]MCH8097046.1 amino acid ABC transporter substrate-binding protein [Pseudomonadota bacterium]
MLKKTAILIAAVFALTATDGYAAELYGTLKKVKDRGVIVMGHREASVPFAYIGPKGKPIGYTVDLCYKIIDKIKATLKMPNLKVKLVPVTSQTRIPLLANGTIDIECGSTTNNLTRSKQIDYLAVTFITGTKLGVKKGSGIKEIEDLNGKSIALSLGTTNEKAIKRVAKQKGLKIKYHMVKDHPQGWLALETDRVDAYATDDVLLYGLISKSKKPGQFEVVGRFLSYDPYGIMVRRDDSAMRLLGNTVLADLMRSGGMQKVYDKWFNPGQTKINMPISSTLKTAFEVQALPY